MSHHNDLIIAINEGIWTNIDPAYPDQVRIRYFVREPKSGHGLDCGYDKDVALRVATALHAQHQDAK